MRQVLLLTSVLLLPACFGRSEFSESAAAAHQQTGTDGSGSPTPVIDPGPPLVASAGPRGLERLTRRQFQATVRALLEDEVDVATLPTELTGSSGFDAAGLVGSVDADALMITAEAVAARNRSRLTTLVACDLEARGEPACARQFIAEFGARAFRRPLFAHEQEELETLYALARAELAADHVDGLRIVLQVLLQAPQLLYHLERVVPLVVDPDGLVTLDGYELASRLSYFVTGSPPDAELIEAAASGELMTDVGLESHARRLLATSLARDQMVDFFIQWLQVRDAATAPRAPSVIAAEELQAVRPWLLEEVSAFVRQIVFEENGTLSELLTRSESFLNEPLAKLYGVSGITGTELRRVALPPEQRGGLLTLPAFLFTGHSPLETDPIQRGKRISERLLCQVLPSPPATVPDLPPVRENQTTRERFAEHSTNPSCSGCHVLLDSVGFGLEQFDNVGRYRETEHGEPVDATAHLPLGDAPPVPFNGVLDLSRQLLASADFEDCFTRQWLRYSLGRSDLGADGFSHARLRERFSASGGRIQELVVALTLSPSFRRRSLAAGEVVP